MPDDSPPVSTTSATGRHVPLLSLSCQIWPKSASSWTIRLFLLVSMLSGDVKPTNFGWSAGASPSASTVKLSTSSGSSSFSTNLNIRPLSASPAVPDGRWIRPVAGLGTTRLAPVSATYITRGSFLSTARSSRRTNVNTLLVIDHSSSASWGGSAVVPLATSSGTGIHSPRISSSRPRSR